jgi:hypothetical protein
MGIVMSLYCLVYESFANQEMSDNDLKELLAIARLKNAELNITGMLLFKNGFFMQALEGEEEVIKESLSKIIKDPRHRDILVIYNKQIEERRFPDWQMGFNKIDDSSANLIEGFSSFLHKPTPRFFKHQATQVELLLDQFKHKNIF